MLRGTMTVTVTSAVMAGELPSGTQKDVTGPGLPLSGHQHCPPCTYV